MGKKKKTTIWWLCGSCTSKQHGAAKQQQKNRRTISPHLAVSSQTASESSKRAPAQIQPISHNHKSPITFQKFNTNPIESRNTWRRGKQREGEKLGVEEEMRGGLKMRRDWEGIVVSVAVGWRFEFTNIFGFFFTSEPSHWQQPLSHILSLSQSWTSRRCWLFCISTTSELHAHAGEWALSWQPSVGPSNLFSV